MTVFLYIQTHCPHSVHDITDTLVHFCDLSEIRKRNITLMYMQRYPRPLLMAELGADHLFELREDLIFSLLPFISVEHGESSLLVRAVDLIFLSQSHSLHATVPEIQRRTAF